MPSATGVSGKRVPTPAVAGGCKPSAASRLPSDRGVQLRHTRRAQRQNHAARNGHHNNREVSTTRLSLKNCSDSVLPLQVWGHRAYPGLPADTGFSLTHYRLLSIQLVDNLAEK